MNLAKARVVFLTTLLFNSLFLHVLTIVWFLPLLLPALTHVYRAYRIYSIASTLIEGLKSDSEKTDLAFKYLAEHEARLEQIEIMNNLTRSIDETRVLLIKHITIKHTMDKITKYEYMILTRYKQMLLYKEHQDTLEIATLLDFARKSALPNGSSMHIMLDMYHVTLLGPRDRERYAENIFTKLARSHKDLYGPDRTSKFMHKFYTEIVNTQLKGYSVLEFSWMILRAFKKGNFTMEKMFAHEEFQERLERTERMFRKAITWKCEPPKESKGKKRSEFQQLLKGFQKDEVIMFTSGSCMDGCKDLQDTETLSSVANEHCNPENECKGRLYECDYSGREPMVCLSPGEGKRSVDMIEYNDGEIEGKNVKCP